MDIVFAAVVVLHYKDIVLAAVVLRYIDTVLAAVVVLHYIECHFPAELDDSFMLLTFEGVSHSCCC